MEHFQRAWKDIQPQLVPFFLYGLAGIFISACAFYIPILSVFRELKAALAQHRVPDLKNAFNLEKIKGDLPMWGTLIGTQFALSIVLGMLTLPIIVISVVFGEQYELLVILLTCAVFGFIGLISMFAVILMFWAPWIYLSEKTTPLNALKASVLYGKSTFLQVLIHLLIIYFSMMVGSLFCYLPAFLALTVGAVASIYLYEAHRPRIQQLLSEHQLLTVE